MLNREQKIFAEEHAPCYIYDREVIAKHCHALKNAMPEVEFLYSIKANPFLPVVDEITREGFGADAASAAEVEIALKAGMSPSEIFYSSPGKSKEDLTRTLGQCTIIADSFHELDLLHDIAEEEKKTVSVGLRINPNFGMFGGSGASSKFGIDEDDLDDLPNYLENRKGLEIRGIHIHLQSQVLNAEILGDYWHHCYALAERVNDIPGVCMDFINFGSGLGVDYAAEDEPLDLTALAQVMHALDRKNRKELGARFYVETGRYIVCRAGTYCTPIVDIKWSRGEKYLIVKNGLNGFFRPSMAEMMKSADGIRPEGGMEPLYTSGSAFEIVLLPADDSEDRGEAKETVAIVGNLCTSQDVIANEIELPPAKIGDVIAISHAGSYGYNLTPLLFSSHDLPGQYLL